MSTEPWMKIGQDRASVSIDETRMNALADAYTHGTNTSDAAFVACAIRYAIAAEHEACAKVADGYGAFTASRDIQDQAAQHTAESIAEDIRNRATGA